MSNKEVGDMIYVDECNIGPENEVTHRFTGGLATISYIGEDTKSVPSCTYFRIREAPCLKLCLETLLESQIKLRGKFGEEAGVLIKLAPLKCTVLNKSSYGSDPDLAFPLEDPSITKMRQTTSPQISQK